MVFKLMCLSIFCLMLLINNVRTRNIALSAREMARQEELFAKLSNGTYNSRLRPSPNGKAVEVQTSIYIYSMSSIDELRTDYTMQLLYRQTWTDDRLKFPTDESVQKIVGDNWHAQQIWTPTIHAVNDRDLQSFAGDAEGTVLLHIQPSGEVLLSKRVKLRPFCKMEFYKYPMDKQQCSVEIESSILADSDLKLKWADDDPLDFNENFGLTGFLLINHTLKDSVATYSQTGNFSRLTVAFGLQREFGHFVLDIYIPSILFVVTSWLTFWIEIPAAPARVTLCMTTMLTLVTSEKSIREKLPKVNYVHALDIWNVVCTGFIFASLVQYALVNYIYHKDKRSRKRRALLKRVESSMTVYSAECDMGSTARICEKKGDTHLTVPGMPAEKAASFACLSDLQGSHHLDTSYIDELKMTPQDIANSIDRKCRYIFPAGFLVFNFIYWLVLWL